MRIDCQDIELYVERITETYTGVELLGVGGYSNDPVTIAIRYDEETALSLISRQRAGETRYHFSTQLPLESNKQTIRILSVTDQQERVLFEQAVADFNPVPRNATVDSPALPPNFRRLQKLSGLLQRGLHSVVSGQILSPWRWRARLTRYHEYFLKQQKRLKNKLLRRRFRPRSIHQAYIENTRINERKIVVLQEQAKNLRYKPTISILLPIWNSDPRWLSAAVQSVFDQIYPHWELCISDDASTKDAHLPLIKKYKLDPRVKYIRREKNGHISANSNSAADLATGEFVALLDHDDMLAPHALLAIALHLQGQPDLDLIYSDEDKITEAGERYDPQFKPDWSPDLLLSYNYINHFTCIRRSVFEKVGRFRLGFEGSQDHDLLLRVTEQTDRIQHIPEILYHWRAVQESTAGSAGVKPYVHTAGRRAVEEALTRRNANTTLYVPPFAERLGLPVLASDMTDQGPSVAIIIHGKSLPAAKTAQAIKRITNYRDFSLYLVIDNATPAEALNRMAASRDETFVLFLQAGTHPSDPRWLSRLIANMTPNVGAACGLIRDSAGSIVSAGTVLSMHDGTAPGHACLGVPRDQISYYFYAEVTRTVTATAQGCLLTRRDLFDRLGGFDSDRYANTLFDVDYCLRLKGQGFRTVHVGGAEFKRETTANLDRQDDPRERLRLKQAYGRRRDAYYPATMSNRHSFQQSGDNAASYVVSTTPIKAWVAAHNLNSPEGAPRYLSEIVLGLMSKNRLIPRVFSPLGGAGADVYHDAKVPVTIADAAWSRRFVDGQWSPLEYEAVQRHLKQELRRAAPEVVIANTLLTFPVVEAAARLGIPSVWIIHESYSSEIRQRFYSPYANGLVDQALAVATRVVPASHDTARLFPQGQTRGQMRILHNGIPTEEIEYYRKSHLNHKSNNTVRILTMGTVCERKGQHLLIEAAAELRKTQSNFEIQIVGVRPSVPYADYIQSLVKRRGLEGCVHLIPETSQPYMYYNQADIFVCTSYIETYSRAMLEAEAFGLPIVSTACCGVSEQVAWGFNALRFEMGDAKGLAASLEQLLRDPQLLRTMGQQSRAMFDNHLSYGEMLDQYDRLIRGACFGELPVDTIIPCASPLSRQRAA